MKNDWFFFHVNYILSFIIKTFQVNLLNFQVKLLLSLLYILFVNIGRNLGIYIIRQGPATNKT